MEICKSKQNKRSVMLGLWLLVVWKAFVYIVHIHVCIDM